MNFLGHCLFSDTTPSALAGSLWPDFGQKPPLEYCSEDFLIHFDRHQSIDRITDRHSALEPLRQVLRPVFRKTTPVVVDMLLDHFLANHWQQFHSLPLNAFAELTYQRLNLFNEFDMPERMQRTLHWMTLQNWFVSYQSEDGIKRALEGVAKRIRFQNPIADNLDIALDIYSDFLPEMSVFLDALCSEIL